MVLGQLVLVTPVRQVPASMEVGQERHREEQQGLLRVPGRDPMGRARGSWEEVSETAQCLLWTDESVVLVGQGEAVALQKVPLEP